MNPASIVDMLEPLREPAAISWWPLAPGWWLLLALLCAALLAVTVRLWKRYRRGAPLREARQRLDALRSADDLSPAEKIAQLGLLQRQLAIAVAGRSACAGLTGEDWSVFLNQLGAGDKVFDAQHAELPYRPQVRPEECAAAIEATANWLRGVRLSQ